MRELKRGVRVVDERAGRGMLKIGDVAKRSGVGREALRFYENGGLLDKPARTPSGFRVYGEEVLERLAFIKRAQGVGLSLDEIKGIIDRASSGQDSCDEVRELVRRRVAELDRQLREMQRYRSQLKSTLEGWERLGQVRGHICGLIEGSSIEPCARHKTEGLKQAARAL
jgi:MerR family transcriptional regulator, copper efflux regulator